MALPSISPNAGIDEIREIVRVLIIEIRQMQGQNLQNVEGWAGNQSNVTEDRAFDANSTTTAELADVLGTLIDDLLTKRILK